MHRLQSRVEHDGHAVLGRARPHYNLVHVIDYNLLLLLVVRLLPVVNIAIKHLHRLPLPEKPPDTKW